MDAAKQYVENCKREGNREGKRTERERMHDALYKTPGCKIYIGKNRSIIDEMRDNLPQARHDEQDATALALNAERYRKELDQQPVLDKPERIHVDLPNEKLLNEKMLFGKEKSAKQQLDEYLERMLREYGAKHGYPVYYVLTEKECLPKTVIGGKVINGGHIYLFHSKVMASSFARSHERAGGDCLFEVYDKPTEGKA